MAKKKTGKRAGAVIGAAALAATAAGAAAGYYFYVSKDAKSNRKLAAKWARDLKSDVVREAKKVGDVSKADVIKLVDKATKVYTSARSVDPAELRRAAAELRSNWSEIIAEAEGGAKKAAKRAKGSAKRAVKKATKKVSRKTK